jgi:hypothetical protein
MYGAAPVEVGQFNPAWTEFMHYLYMPVRMRLSDPYDGNAGIRLEVRLGMFYPMVMAALADARKQGFTNPYVYLTARRGVATPENPLNRPGWHCDGFGTDDLNYIWYDRFPTRFAQGEFHDISDSHIDSLEQFEQQSRGLYHYTYPNCRLLRLNRYVVHNTPLVEATAVRSFLKISISNHRYNLVGNSHNYLFDYDWPMFDRSLIRNDPARAGLDYVENT